VPHYVASGFANHHILSWSSSPEIGRLAAGRASGIKTSWGAWLGLLSLSAVCCVAAAGLLVVYSERWEREETSD